ncbi:MAG: WD40 repeat domain-containing protein, partial [Pseudomonadota bacterium]
DTETAAVRMLRGHGDALVSVAFAADGKHLAASTWQSPVFLWDLQTATMKKLEGHTLQAARLAFSPDSRLLASGSFDNTVRLWDGETGEARATMIGHTDIVTELAFSPDGGLLASASKDKTVRLWDAASGQARGVLEGHGDIINGLVFPSAENVVSASSDKTVRVWDLATGQAIRVVKRATDRLQLVSAAGVSTGVSAGNRRVLGLGRHEAGIQIWDMETDVATTIPTTGKTSDLRGWMVTPDGQFLATGGEDKLVSLYWATAIEKEKPPSGHLASTRIAIFSPDGERVASSGGDKTIRLWDVVTGAEKKVIEGHTAAVTYLAYSPDGKLLASAANDRSVRLWDAESGAPLLVLVGHRGWAVSVAFSADGKLLASSGYDKTVRIWDTVSGAQKHLLEGHEHVVWETAFRPDGKELVSASVDRTVRLWNVQTGSLARVLTGHTGPIRSVCYSNDGRLVVSGGLDKTVRVWDPATGKAVAVLDHGGRVFWVYPFPKGNQVIATGDAGKLIDLDRLASLSINERISKLGLFRVDPDGSLAVSPLDDGAVVLYDFQRGSQYWSAPLMLSSGPEAYTHRGWIRLDSPPESSTAAGGAAPANQDTSTPAAAPGQNKKWRRAVAERAWQAAEDASSELLCLGTARDEPTSEPKTEPKIEPKIEPKDGIEIWDRAKDELLATATVSKLESLIAIDNACLARADGKAIVVDREGRARVLAAQGVTAAAWDNGQILLAMPGKVLVLDPTGEGKEQASYSAGLGVTAIARADGWLVLGFKEGQMELVPIAAGQAKPSFTFEDVAPNPVVRLLEGPMGTIVAGFSGGLVGIWSLKNGTALFRAKLHGQAAHLLIKDEKLYAVTTLGDYLVLDLDVFHEPYCDLLAEVWRRVPVVWEDGLPVRRSPPATHQCGDHRE